MDRKAIIAQVRKTVELANVKFKMNMMMPEVGFYAKGVVAGRAHYMSHKVTFNETLARDNPTKFHETVIHEVAHLVTKKVYPYAKQAHGPEFKFVDKTLGGRGTRCHSYDVKNAKKLYTKYVLECACGPIHKVTAKIANKASQYHCRKCKTNLKNTGKVVKA